MMSGGIFCGILGSSHLKHPKSVVIYPKVSNASLNRKKQQAQTHMYSALDPSSSVSFLRSASLFNVISVFFSSVFVKLQTHMSREALLYGKDLKAPGRCKICKI